MKATLYLKHRVFLRSDVGGEGGEPVFVNMLDVEVRTRDQQNQNGMTVLTALGKMMGDYGWVSLDPTVLFVPYTNILALESDEDEDLT